MCVCIYIYIYIRNAVTFHTHTHIYIYIYIYRRRWEDNIKMDLQVAGGGPGDWMELAQDSDRWWALVGTVRDFRVPLMRGIS